MKSLRKVKEDMEFSPSLSHTLRDRERERDIFIIYYYYYLKFFLLLLIQKSLTKW